MTLKELIKQSDNIVFFGGAGVSTESGIPDFRSETGIYNTIKRYKRSPEEILSHSFFMAHPDIFYDFYKSTMLYLDAKPNAAHLALAKLEEMGKLKAVVSITIDDEFVVHDIKVIEGEKGMFIAMPSKKAMDGEYRDIAHPINSNTRERIQSMILEKYEQALAEEPDGENP